MATARAAGLERVERAERRGRALARWIAGIGISGAIASFAWGAPSSDDLARAADAAAAPAATHAGWRRFALNALLVPLLEPDGPATWAEPNEMQPCRDSADVRVDGRPLPAGRPLPLHRPIVVRFRLNDCWPMGSAWIGLSGTLEMTVVNDGARLVARVRPLDLDVAMNGVRVALRDEFAGAVSLAVARVRP